MDQQSRPVQPLQAPPRRGVWREIRLFFFLVLAILFVLGGYQIWDLILGSQTYVVRAFPEVDQLGFDDSAEWVFKKFEFSLTMREDDEPLAVMPHGPDNERTGSFTVRGRSLKRAIESEAFVGLLYYPGYESDDLSVSTRLVSAYQDTLVFELTRAQASSFLTKQLRTFISVRDAYQRPVAELKSVLGIPLEERNREPGVYDISIRADELIWVLEEQGKYTLQVQSQSGLSPPQNLEVPAQWFIREGRESRIVSLAGDRPDSGGTPPPEQAATVVTPPPEPAREETPPPQPVRERTPPPATPTPAREETPAATPAPQQTRPTPPPTPTEGTLEIRALPFASFYVDGELRAENVPVARVTVSAGRHDVRVAHPLFETREWNGVEVRGGASQSLFHAFPSDANGGVRVTVSRGWANVYLDGEDSGKTTPCVLDALRVGNHTVSLWQAGQPIPGAEQSVVVRQGQTAEASFELP